MFTRKNTLISLAVVAFLAGCGGGGSGGSPAASTPASAAGSGSAGSGSAGIAATSDAKFADTMVLASDQVAGIYNGQPMGIGYTNYTSTDPTVNAAYGNTSYGAFGMDKGTNAPIVGFGYRLGFNGTNGTCTAGSKTGRIGFELKDQAGAAEQKVLQVMVDNITVTEAADCSYTVTQGAGSKVYVYAKNAAGQTANGSAAAPANVVSLTPSGDGSSSFLMLNVNAAVGAAKAAATGTAAATLGSVATFTSGQAKPFESSMTLSTVKMTRADGTTPLAGKAISVTNSGVAGIADGGGVPLGHIQVE